MIHDYWRSKFASILRTVVTVAVYAFVGRFIAYQYTRSTSPEAMFSFKKNNTDSSLLLPVACFLDPSFDPFRGLSDTEVNALGGSRTRTATPELVVYAILATCFILAHIIRFLYRHRRAPILFTLFPLLPCGGCCVWCFVHVLILRAWVHNTGWMEGHRGRYGNPEQDIRGIGQIVPLVTLGWVAVLCIEGASRRTMAASMSQKD
jgi:hypothetical protein